MQHNKLQKLVRHYGKPVDDLIKGWYVDEKLPAQQIALKITSEAGVLVTARGIEYILKK